MTDIHPTKKEEMFLKLGYNRFLDLFDKIMLDTFWEESAEQRLLLIKELCSTYVELLKYEPIDFLINESNRLNHKLVGADFIKMLRNLLLHFPFFKEWNEIEFSRDLITGMENSGSIDRFMLKSHPKCIKYRFWEPVSKKMTYIEVKLDQGYSDGKDVKLKNILPEKDGVKFLSIFMRDILMTQIEKLGSPE